MIANAQQARQLVKNSKYYRLDSLLLKIEQFAKSGVTDYHEPSKLSPEESMALQQRGFTLTPVGGYTKISWEEST